MFPIRHAFTAEVASLDFVIDESVGTRIFAKLAPPPSSDLSNMFIAEGGRANFVRERGKGQWRGGGIKDKGFSGGEKELSRVLLRI